MMKRLRRYLPIGLYEPAPDGGAVPRPTYLEGARGFAAWMVVLGHSLNAFFPNLTGAQAGPRVIGSLAYELMSSPLALPLKAHFAFIFFFVHSGVVLSFKFFTTPNGKQILYGAAFRRYFRLAGPVIASIMLSYVLLKAGLYVTAPVAEFTGSAWLKMHFQFPANFWMALRQGVIDTFFNSDLEGNAMYNSSLWTIQKEFAGSFLVFGSLFVWGRWRLRWIAYVVTVLFFLKGLLLAFVLGIFLCDLYVSRYRLRSPAWPKWLVPVTTLTGLYLSCADRLAARSIAYKPISSILALGQDELVQTAGAALLVFSLLHWRGAQSFLNRSLPQFLGRISYSVYVLHLLVICSVSCWLDAFLREQAWPPVSAAFAAILATVAVTTAGARVFRIWMDEPSIRFARRLEAKVLGRPRVRIREQDDAPL